MEKLLKGQKMSDWTEKTEIYDLITDSDLTDDLLMLSEVIGIDNVRKLLRVFGGISFYIPKLKRLDVFVTRYIRSNKSKPFKELARDLSIGNIYQIGNQE
jgi:hypothetical protein